MDKMRSSDPHGVGTAASPERIALIQQQLKGWSDSLINLDGRNPLLRLRELKVGTLTLPPEAPQFIGSLARGDRVHIDSLAAEHLAADPSSISTDYSKKALAIYKKAKENAEERGVSTARLISGLVCGFTSDDKPIAAPLLIQSIDLVPTDSSYRNFKLQLDAADSPVEFNPILLRHFEREGETLDHDKLSALLEAFPSPITAIDEAWQLFVSMLRNPRAFDLEKKSVIGNFSYAKLPMVADLEGALHLALGNAVVLALAGDREARSEAMGSGGETSMDQPDRTPPADEFLVLDADSSQSYVINSALGGRNLIVQGPPGTGKSQTIANLISTLSARGKTCLFVAEKRAAIDAVLKRLSETGLGHLVLDMHDPSSSKGQLRKQILASLAEAKQTAPTVNRANPLVATRTALIEQQSALHKVRTPWELSAYDVMAELSGLAAGPNIRLPASALERFTPAVMQELNEIMFDCAERGAFSVGLIDSGWADADLTTTERAGSAVEVIDRLASDRLPELKLNLRRLLRTTGLPEPETLHSWKQTFSLLGTLQHAVETFTPAIFEADLTTAIAAFSSSSWRKENQVSDGWFARRRNRKFIKSICARELSKSESFAELTTAQDAIAQWESSAGARPSELPVDWAGISAEYEQLCATLESIGAIVGMAALANESLDAAQNRASRLLSGRDFAASIPSLRRHEARLAALGLSEVYDSFKGTDSSPALAADTVRYTILQNLISTWQLSDEHLQGRGSDALDERARRFIELDIIHIRDAAPRVARRAAENLVRARSEHKDQDDLLASELRKQRRLMPTRDLIAETSDVILAAKPCWAMSPLMVSQLLPRQKLFDVVIFDEASQVEPADAVPSILRGSQVVVAGDRHQLPPSRFFAGEVDIESEDAPETAAYESLIDALAGICTEKSLQWHYRSQDERLIAVSNRQIYGGSLVTFPGARTDDCLKFIHVPHTDEPADGDSASAEVLAVVDEVITHARTRKTETLGVIAPGVKHANRIDAAVRDAIQGDRELLDWFSDEQREPFFVKNLERVQGDERDVIIISTGYARRTNGRLAQAFGPINQAGGERRLNVAASRARKRMTLISSFTAADLDAAATGRGRQFLRSLFEFIESGGTQLASGALGEIPMNPFELQIFDALTSAGLNVVPQYGVSGYRIDFAVQHPQRLGDFVLAVEADGAQYHSSHTARDRDRLRQEHLERLGWEFHRIWSTAWFADPIRETDRTLAAYEHALSDTRSVIQAPDVMRESQPVAVVEVAGADRGPAPFGRGERASIMDYQDRELIELAAWLRRDGVLRTPEEAVREMNAYMGFQRLGARIREYLEWAWAESA